MKEEDEEGEDDKEKLLATKSEDGPHSKDPHPRPHPAIHRAGFRRTRARSLETVASLPRTENTCPASISLYLIGQNCAPCLSLNF